MENWILEKGLVYMRLIYLINKCEFILNNKYESMLIGMRILYTRGLRFYCGMNNSLMWVRWAWLEGSPKNHYEKKSTWNLTIITFNLCTRQINYKCSLILSLIILNSYRFQFIWRYKHLKIFTIPMRLGGLWYFLNREFVKKGRKSVFLHLTND